MKKLFKGEVEESDDPRPNHYSQKEGHVECIKVIKQLCLEHQNDPYKIGRASCRERV